ncbi:MAG: hypothetical protein ACRDRK_12045 [Pseudonocardia sp.]
MNVAPPGPLRPADPRPPDPGEAVAKAMAALEGLEGRPPGEHVEAFERVHAALSDALTAGSPVAGPV